MNNAQLNNIIRFSFNFHQTMGNKIHEFDPGYILEKWTKYFGDVKPNPISDITHSYIKSHFSKWIEKWGEGSYTEMSKYLSIIHSINTKGFRIYDAENIIYWLPSELISLFERSTKGDISNVEYRGLHYIIEREVEDWLKQDKVKKDIIQIQRDMKIDVLLERK
jgi:hypothetical protein